MSNHPKHSIGDTCMVTLKNDKTGTPVPMTATQVDGDSVKLLATATFATKPNWPGGITMLASDARIVWDGV